MRFDQLLLRVHDFEIGADRHFRDFEEFRELAGAGLTDPLKFQHDLLPPLFCKHM